MLAAQTVSYAYSTGARVLHEVSVQLRRGEILYLLGHNGSGKTTLLSCLSGILRPVQGQVLLDGRDIREYPHAQRAQKVGLIPQMHTPVFTYTVREMVLMGRAPHLGLFGRPRQDDYAIADSSLEQVGLADFRDRAYTELSGGERQLVMVARGLAQQCDFLLMDEPDAHLDPSNQHRIFEVVLRLAEEKHLAFGIASHVPNSALMYADKVLLLHKGHTLAYGCVDETLTETLLTKAYGMATEVIYKNANGRRSPRAILPRRKTVAPDAEMITLKPASFDDLGSPIRGVFDAGEHTPQILLITGERGSGKSSWCADLVMQAQRHGMTVSGVLSPAVVKDGLKVGIDLVTIANGRRQRLANLRQTTAADIVTDMWAFDSATIEAGNHALENLPPDCALLVVDELGPLEFQRAQGLVNGLSAVDQRGYRVACVVVRPELLPEALVRWPEAYVVDVDDD